MTEKLSERMSRMGDVVSANHYSKEVEALEDENKNLRYTNNILLKKQTEDSETIERWGNILRDYEAKLGVKID